jgi:methionyl-tRNA synthetase
VYVWFDALINYITAAGFPEPGYDRLWPADLHVIGKGITRLHCALWPAMLLSADLALPRMVWAHGYVQWGGAKVSKSSGGALSVDEAIEYHGVDALRYFLLREVGFTNDGDFTWERLDARYVADLADTLGNFVKRSLDMIQRYRGGTVPRGAALGPLDDAARDTVATYRRALDGYRLEEGAAHWMDLAARANRYIQETVPWELAKGGAGKAAELDRVLGELARTVARLAVLGQPFVPGAAEAIWSLFPEAPRLSGVRLQGVAGLDVAGQRIAKPPILFPKPKPAPA